MKTQKELFLTSEGNKWFQRNKVVYQHTEENQSVIVNTLKRLELLPGTVLEIGCSNGRRLHDLHSVFGSRCYGIDPSATAIAEGQREYPDLDLRVGTADTLPFLNQSLETVVFGFCLCYCDRRDMFKIAMEADRCLQNNGRLILLDFSPPFPYKNQYVHREGVYVYKMDSASLFSWNPAYAEISHSIFSHNGNAERHLPDERIAVTVLRKSEEIAYPFEPFGQ